MSKDDVFDYVMESPQDTNPTVLRSLLNGIQEGGAAALPEVTSSDNGKLLTVVDGEWATAESMTFTGGYSQGKVYFSVGTTQKEVVDAYKAGKEIKFYVTDQGTANQNKILLVPNVSSNSETSVVFSGVYAGDGAGIMYSITLDGTSTMALGAGVNALRTALVDSTPYLVTVTQSGTSYSANRTAQELVSALNAGKNVMCYMYGIYYTATSYESTSLNRVIFDGTVINSTIITIDDNGTTVENSADFYKTLLDIT